MKGKPKKSNNTNQPAQNQRVKWAVNGGIAAVAITGLTVVGYLVDLKELVKHFGFSVPGENLIKAVQYPPPEWIGTKIEHIYNKQLPGYKFAITLIETDKVGGDNLVLRNIDQDLTSINRAQKYNSGDYAVHLRRLKESQVPVCLEIYGRRFPKNSEFKNVIQINKWSSSKDYYTLTSVERDKECQRYKDLPLTIIVHPKS
jgi:hypothetical protein